MLFASILLLTAQAAAPGRPNPMLLGPAVGQPLPRFEARDQTGVVRNFSSLKGSKGLVLVFFRSADW